MNNLTLTQLETLLEFSKLLNTSLDLNEMLRHLLRSVLGHLLTSKGLIAIMDKDSSNYKIALVRGVADLKIGDLFDRNSFNHSSIYRIYAIGNVSSPMGYLAVGCPIKGEITVKENETIAVLLNIAINSINNATTYRQVEFLNKELSQKNQDLNTLLEFSREISSVIDPENIMLMLALTLTGHWGIKKYAFTVWKKPYTVILREKGITLPKEKLLREILANISTPILISSLPSSNVREALLSQGAEVIFPIFTISSENQQNKINLIGLVALGQNLRQNYTMLELNFGASLVAQTSVALQNAWHVREIVERNQATVRLAAQKQASLVFSTFSELLKGFVLDEKYCLEEKIGIGGFGAVYKAKHLGLDNFVAIKILRPVPGNDSKEQAERFRREGITACKINHPNAVSVIDFGISKEGISYLVMELLVGFSLAKRIKTNRLFSLKECVEVLLPICSMLEQAHSLAMVHRDIKPENIFLHQSANGEVVKVVDFGLAKIYAKNSDSQTINLTNEEIIGTPYYMSPERLSGSFSDGRADIYSLGVMLYRMLSGRLPFDYPENTPYSIGITNITQNPIPLGKSNPAISLEIEEIVMQTLNKKFNKRPSAKELAEKFRKAAENSPCYETDPYDLSNNTTTDFKEIRTQENKNSKDTV